MGAKFSSGGGATVFYDKTDTPGEIVTELVNASDGAGLHFDGSGSIDIASPPDLGTKFSFEFVLSAVDWATASYRCIIDFGSSGRFRFGQETAEGSGTNLSIYDTDNRDFGVSVLDDGKVHHLVVTINGTAAVLYDNGNQVGTTTLGATPTIDSATDARIGSNFIASSGFFNGTIYRTRFYNRTLSADDVRTAYERADVPVADQYGSQTSLVDAGASVFTSGTYSWSAYGSNTIANVGNALEITYVDHASGAQDILRNASDLTTDLTVGKRYRLTVDAKYTGGSAGAKLQLSLAGSNTDFATLTTSLVTYTYEFTTDTAAGGTFRMSGMSAGNVVTIDNWYLREIGCVSDYDLAFANENQSRMVADRSTNNVDGEMSSSGVKQTQVIKQLNSTAMRVGGTSATPATPADGVIIADKLGIGIAPSHAATIYGTGAGNATLQIEGEGGADPTINFLTNNATHWAVGVDDSDSDNFKIVQHSAIGSTNNYVTIDTSGHIVLPTAGQTIKTDLSSGGTTRTGVIELYNGSTGALSLKTDNQATGGIELWTEGAKRLDVQRDGVCTFSNGITVSGGFLSLDTPTELTIASGAVTVTRSFHDVDTEGDAATDDLDTINGGSVGDILTLKTVTGSRDVTVKDATGNLRLAGDFTLTSPNDTITLIKYSTVWIETSRSDNV